jgi:adenylate cyclase
VSGATGASRSQLLAGAGLLALPLVGLVVLLAAPAADVRWEHHPSHFWLVVGAGAVNAVLAYATGATATRRADARVFLVSLGFLASAGFLTLHALATPQVLLETTNAGFALATPIGLVVAAVFAAASSGHLSGAAGAWVMRNARALQAALVAVLVAWGVLSLGSLPPFEGAAAPERVSGPLIILAAMALGLYAFAIARYFQLFRARRAGLLLAFVVAFVLLAQAMVAVAFARNWHASWWLWHALLLIAFAVIAVAAHRQWHEERFSDLYLDDTVAGTRDISVLFADLAGFTTFSERHRPAEVAEMLNTYFGAAVPAVVRRHGGDIDRLIGDAVMATFNRRGDQPDHPLRAARAALDLQRAVGEVADAHPEWPRFRAGVNTGPALLGVLGAAGGRTHTAIGDTVNLASRLEGEAPPGGVVVGPETARRLPGAHIEPLGAMAMKGKEEPVEVGLLVSLDAHATGGEGRR